MSGDLRGISAAGNPILEAHSRLNSVIDEPIYTPVMKVDMIAQLIVLEMVNSDEGP